MKPSPGPSPCSPKPLRPARAKRFSRGSILAAVLGLIALLGFVLVAFLGEAVAKIKYFGLFYNRDDLRVLAYSALDTSLAVLSEIRDIDGGLWSPAQGWQNPLQYANYPIPEGVNITVTFEDESAKFPLRPETDSFIIQTLLEEIGVPFDEASKLVDCLYDWMDPDDEHRLNGWDGDNYEDKEPPCRPSNGPIESWDEFRLIKYWDEFCFDENGLPTDKFRQLRSALSLDNDGMVNLNSATGLVLQVLHKTAGLDILAISQYLSGADGIAGTEDDQYYHSDPGQNPDLGGNSLRSPITVKKSARSTPNLPPIKIITPGQNPAGQNPGGQSGSIGIGESTGSGSTGQSYGYQVGLLRVTVMVERGEANFLVNALVRYRGANPSANAEMAREERDQANENDAESQRQRDGAATAHATDAGSALGYPFEIVRLTENEKL